MRGAVTAWALVLIMGLMQASVSWAQAGLGAGGPAAPWINRTFSFENKWAMYGAPRETRLDEDGFHFLVSQVRQSKFAAQHVQIVVIMRGADASGTMGLIEKRGKRVISTYLKESGPEVYDVWHDIGYNTSPEKIASDFRENILAAEEVYRDLPIVFNGTVRSVSKDERGEIFVEFIVKGREAGLACYPWQHAPQGVDLRELKAGSRLKVSGQFTSLLEGEAIKMRGCLFSRL